MKTAFRVVVTGVVVLLGLVIVRYRHVDPCKALEREIVRQVQQNMQTASDSLQQAVAGIHEEAGKAAGEVASAVENIAVGVAQGAAKTKVEHLSRRECVVELWKMARED